MKFLLYIFLIFSAVVTAVGCIEDGVTTSPSDRPVFSVDTLKMGDVFSDDRTATFKFTVHNRHSKSLVFSDIRLGSADAGYFRINVDGLSGTSFSDVEVRAKDSIFVFVDALLPETSGLADDYEATVDFTANGVTESVVVTARGVNATRIRGDVVDTDTRFVPGRPYIVYDSLVVAEGARLTLEAGTRLCFHDKAMLVVRGSLTAEGRHDARVELSGDRTGNVVSDISFDIMSRQWTGVFFIKTSKDNRLENTEIRNTVQGVAVRGDSLADYTATPQLTMVNTRLRNSAGTVLEAYHTGIRAVGCEFAEGGAGLVYLEGGNHYFSQCTFSNNYLFSVISGAALQLAHINEENDLTADGAERMPYIKATFDNSIIYGIGADIAPGDLTGSEVYVRTCLLKSKGEDDDNFLSCLWDKDPVFYTVRNDYIFDYRLRDGSEAIGVGYDTYVPDDARVDGYGLTRQSPPDLGAYVYTPETKE